MRIDPNMEQKINQYDQLRQQYQNIATQVIQIKQFLNETERGIKELTKLEEEDKVYRETGSILIEVSDREELTEDLREKKENLKIQLKRFEDQESELKKQLKQMQSDLERELPDHS